MPVSESAHLPEDIRPGESCFAFSPDYPVEAHSSSCAQDDDYAAALTLHQCKISSIDASGSASFKRASSRTEFLNTNRALC